MPRPKRSKVAPSAPVRVHQRVDPPAHAASAAQKKQAIISPGSSGRVTNGCDDSDSLVVTKKTGARTPMAQGYKMSGALAPEDVESTRLEPPSGQTRAAVSKIVREADYVKTVAEKAKNATQTESRAEPDQIPSSIPSHDLGSNRPSSSHLGYSSPSYSVQVGSGMKVQETPRLQSSSMLGGATFRKRPRQPSLLQMAQSHGYSPDVLNVSDMYGFLPDDESTPIIKSLSQTTARGKSSSSKQAPGSRKRKMKSPEVQVPASQSFDGLSSPSAVPSLPDHQQSASEVDDQPQPTLPPLRSNHTPQPEIFSDTMAPPRSSSSRPEPTPKKARQKFAKFPTTTKARGQQALRKQQSLAASPLSSISTQVSPVRPPPKPLTTASLQNLLPRRRARPKPKGIYDIASSSDVELDNTALGEDEDELSFHASSKMRRKKQSMGAAKKPAREKDGGIGRKGKRISKTYTRKSVADSEREDHSSIENIEESAGLGRSRTPGLDSKAKAEMKRLADKFREVDEYALEYEDMTGSSGYMMDAR